MDVRDRFLSAIDYIEDHLLEPVPLPEVAARAGFSPAYFSRLFRALTGETFGAYLRRRRLTVAAGRLLDDGDPIPLVELAFDCQYDSQEAFTRAFKRAFGVPPGAYRREAPRGRLGWRRRIDAEALAHLQEVLTVEPVIREIDSFLVVGVREHFDRESKHHIPELWQRFIPLMSKIEHAKDDAPYGSYGICLNTDTEEGSFDYIAGLQVDRVDTLPEGLVAETVPRQTYAVFTHRIQAQNLHEELQSTMGWIFGTWLPASSYEYTAGPDFEGYPADFMPAPGHSLDIAVPVRSKG